MHRCNVLICEVAFINYYHVIVARFEYLYVFTSIEELKTDYILLIAGEDGPNMITSNLRFSYNGGKGSLW